MLTSDLRLFTCRTLHHVHQNYCNRPLPVLSFMVIKYHIIAVNNISDALAQVISDKDDLVTAADDLTTALNDLGTDIDATISTCASSGAACQTACDTFDTTPLTSASVDFSSVLQLNAFTCTFSRRY